MEGEYKMFIDSLSERNKSKSAIKGFHPCIKSLLFKGNYSLIKRTCYLILLLLMNSSTPFSNYILKGNYSLGKITPFPLYLLNEIAVLYFWLKK